MRNLDGSISKLEILRDITQQKQAEAALRESEAKYMTLVEQAKDGVVIVQDGVLQFVNQAMEELSGYTIDELIGMPFVNLVTLDSRDQLTKRYEARMAGDQVPPFYETKLVCKDGSIKDVEGSVGLIQYQGRPADCAIVRDITTRKRMEKARQDLEERRTNFITITSHELRTPLTAIKGYTEILERRLDEFDQERRDRCFKIINRNVRRLERLIKGVSTLGQIERGVFRLVVKELDFCEFLVEALQRYLTFLGDQLELRNFHELVPTLIQADADRFLQVLDNLIENAVKNSPIERRKIIVTPEILPNVVRVSVADNGAGIAPEDLTRIFDQFTAIPTEYSAGGTGIGLYISQTIVKRHGGTLTAHSAGKDQGATFVMELPRTWVEH